MIPHKPEPMPDDTREMMDAPAGQHRMALNRVKEGVTSPRWSGDVWEFVGGGYQISEFVNELSVWKYSRLARQSEAMPSRRIETPTRTETLSSILCTTWVLRFGSWSKKRSGMARSRPESKGSIRPEDRTTGTSMRFRLTSPATMIPRPKAKRFRPGRTTIFLSD